MFERWSYLGYTLMFCLPPLVLLWLRREFAARMARDLGRILAASLLLTVYGCIIWPVALKMGAWSIIANPHLGSPGTILVAALPRCLHLRSLRAPSRIMNDT